LKTPYLRGPAAGGAELRGDDEGAELIEGGGPPIGREEPEVRDDGRGPMPEPAPEFIEPRAGAAIETGAG